MSLTTTYLGLELKNPLVASASPLTAKLDNIRRLEDAGAGAIVLPSLFQEQIEAEAEALSAPRRRLRGQFAGSAILFSRRRQRPVRRAAGPLPRTRAPRPRRRSTSRSSPV